jgi:hypothetical protein
MPTAKRVLATGGAITVSAVLLFVFVVNFSAVETRFECAGGFTAKTGQRSAAAYVKLHEYRWWVGLWSNADAAIWVEVPNEMVEYFGNVARVGDQLQIRDSQNKIQGNFSTLSKTIALQTYQGFFDGTCKRITA